ncbi:MAG: tetratricopeptide repeat protein [Planctomycetia bacterium]|nr:tetratricopeptide repeat protein [Planctomycetia bacterium]
MRPGDETPAAETEGYEPPAQTAADWGLPGDRYVIVGEIGCGGMGVVLRVLDTSFNRPLAIKVLRNTQSRIDAAERRFVDEARITGQLQHPGIPPVHEVGRLSDGRPFFSMKLIEGRTLAELLTERSSPQDDLPRFLKIFEQIAQTIGYAHSQSVIHRDLKPLNVMVGTFGEVQVMDWGLAKRLAPGEPVEAPLANLPVPSASDAAGRSVTVRVGDDSTDSHTQAGQVMGTFAYMAPEQARGETQALSASWDVFGLGAILCSIITGRPPYLAQASPDLWRQAQNAELGAAWERLDGCGADPELVALAKRCLAPKADDRPRDAGQVAAEMARYLASVQERLQRTIVTQAEAEVTAREERKRRRLAVVLAAAVVVLIVSASVFGLWYANEQARRDVRTQHLNREVAAALDEAIRLRDDLHARLHDPKQAAQMLSEPHQWQSQLESAQGALKRALTLALSGRDLLAPDLLGRLEILAIQLQADEQERELAFALDRIRLEASSLVNGKISLVAATPRLAQVFHDAGYQVEDDDPVETAVRIARSTIRLPLVAGLDFWALATADAPLQGRLLEVARLADPHPWRDRFRQPEVWADQARLKALADEVDFNQQSPQVLAALAYRSSSDVTLIRRALVAHPSDLWLLFQLGLSSSNPVEQAGAFRAAMAVRPEAAVVYFNLGFLQQSQQQYIEAAACYRKAVELEPGYGDAYSNLGMVLDELRQPEEALACYRLATELAPQSVIAHINLGASLHAHGQFDEAIASYRKASEIDPKNTAVLNNLGAAHREKNQLAEAADCYRKALEINGNNAYAWCNLGHILNIEGKFDEALKAMRRGHELGSQQSGWTYPSAIWVLETEARVKLDEKLAAVMRGEVSPADAQEYAGMAELCLNNKKRYATAYRFYEAAFAAAPQLGEDLDDARRFKAACAAALAADGQGEGADELAAEARVAARNQALNWLRADLKVLAELLDHDPKEGPAIVSVLERAQTDPALASVRDVAALSKLSPADQIAWQQLWTDISALRQHAAPATR